MAEDMVEQARDGFSRAAAGWDRWSDLLGQRDDAVRYIEAADVRTGDRVLEIGAGTGDQTLPLARAVGPAGHVLATDLTDEMLAVCRRRVGAAGLDNITFRIVDATVLDLDRGGFDAAISGFTWMFLPDPVASASRVRELLRPGGRFAASVWGPAGEVPMVSVAMGVAVREMELDAPTAGERTAPDLSDAEIFEDVLTTAGFEDVTVDPFTITLSWESAEQYGEWLKDMFIELSDLVAEHAPDRADDIYAAIVDAARSHTCDGALRFDNLALMGAGRRPA